jgi:predicted transcriptional regulator
MEIELSQIKTLRKRLDITQEELSRAAGVSQSLIAKIESGKIDPSFTKVRKITDALYGIQGKKSLSASDIMSRKIISLSPDDSIDHAVKKMSEHGISQLPVLDKGACVGLITEGGLLFSGNKKPEKVREAMQDCPPIIPSKTPISNLAQLIEYSPLILVSENGELRGAITKTDIIKGIYSGKKKV